MKQKMIGSMVAGVAISAVALYFALRNVPFNDLLEYILSINYFWVIPSVLVALIAFAVRALRWQLILKSAYRIGFWQAFHPLMTGFMLNCILPARAGEVARPAILYKRENIPFSTGLATVAAERVFDFILLIVFFAVILSTIQIDPNLDIVFGDYHLNRETLEKVFSGIFRLCIVLITGIILVSLDATRKIINRMIMEIPVRIRIIPLKYRKKIIENICTPLVSIVENFASGFSLVKHPKNMVLCLFLSFVVWILSALSYYIMSLGCPGISLSFSEMTAVMVIICFFIALPSAPGFWGLWEAGGVFALALFGIYSKEAAGFTLANHAIQMFPVIIVGMISAVVLGVNILQVSYPEEKGSVGN